MSSLIVVGAGFADALEAVFLAATTRAALLDAHALAAPVPPRFVRALTSASAPASPTQEHPPSADGNKLAVVCRGFVSTDPPSRFAAGMEFAAERSSFPHWRTP